MGRSGRRARCAGRAGFGADQKFDRAVEPNRPFANQEWQFDRSRLDVAANRAQTPAPLSLDELRMLCAWYADDAAAEQAVAAEAN